MLSRSWNAPRLAQTKGWMLSALSEETWSCLFFSLFFLNIFFYLFSSSMTCCNTLSVIICMSLTPPHLDSLSSLQLVSPSLSPSQSSLSFHLPPPPPRSPFFPLCRWWRCHPCQLWQSSRWLLAGGRGLIPVKTSLH